MRPGAASFSGDPSPLYPRLEPYESGMLQVDGGHRIFWEMCGNPLGQPALFLHGGPGGGCTPDNRRLFDPRRYRIVLFDQRGCGRSTPLGELRDNTTAHLLDDIERLRRTLKIERWLLLGGSWGAALGLAYAQAYPERVSALILRGVFTARQLELRWLYSEGASFIFPEAWEAFIHPIPLAERDHLLDAYHARLTCGLPETERTAALTWCAWEHTVMTLLPHASTAPRDEAALRALARLETHYFVHRAFFVEGQLLDSMHRLADIPGIIVQGRYDMVTPAATARAVHLAWPASKLVIVPDAGHASTEPGIQRALVAATDGFLLSETPGRARRGAGTEYRPIR